MSTTVPTDPHVSSVPPFGNPEATIRVKRHRPGNGRAGAEPTDGDVPIIRLAAGDMPRVVDDTEKALLRSGFAIFTRAGQLLRPVLEPVPSTGGRMTEVARLRPLCVESLTDRIARAAKFQRFDERRKDWVATHPPQQIARTLLVREGEWSFPPISGVIATPTLRRDGSLLSEPGYDRTSRLYLILDKSFRLPPLPPQPSRAEGGEALRLLTGLLTGFPFVGPVDRAVALSGILTAITRPAFSVAPLHGYRARASGTGKSFMVDLISAIATGRPCPVMSVGKTEEETEKRLGALLLSAASLLSLDNVNGELGGDMLCQITERPLVHTRILGRSEMPAIEPRATIFATGNNMILTGDLIRRAVLCTLDAKVDEPERRCFGFNPIERVLENRGLYVSAVLTIIKAYQEAGSPQVCGELGSYSEWSDMVRSPLIWLGEADPITSIDTMRAEDPQLVAIRELFTQWREHLIEETPYRADDVAKAACEQGPHADPLRSDFRDLLLRNAGARGTIENRRLGRWLSSINGRVVDGYRIEMRIDSKHGNRFCLCKASG